MNTLGKTSSLAVCSALAALALSACAHGGGGVYAAGYGHDAPYDVWYDGFYGDIPGGYWGPDGAFYYQDHDGNFARDGGGHFRHGQFGGARGMHAGAPPR